MQFNRIAYKKELFLTSLFSIAFMSAYAVYRSLLCQWKPIF